jgi:hypothetical protein
MQVKSPSDKKSENYLARQEIFHYSLYNNYTFMLKTWWILRKNQQIKKTKIDKSQYIIDDEFWCKKKVFVMGTIKGLWEQEEECKS